MTDEPLEIAVLGDLHGCLDLALDLPLLERYRLRLCTGDLTPNGGPRRFEEALRQAEELREARVHTILGNHDGPPGFTGRAFPKSYVTLATALGEYDVGGRNVELPELDLTLVGARPLSFGGSALRFQPPDRKGWTVEQWAEDIATRIESARATRVVVLAHDGPTGLGERRDDIYGCDFQPGEGDWGDMDLRMALDRVLAGGCPVVAVVAGHMHQRLSGGGERVLAIRERSLLHLNAAVVPRVTRDGRALVVLCLEGRHATARLEWHRPDGSVDTIEVEPRPIG